MGMSVTVDAHTEDARSAARDPDQKAGTQAQPRSLHLLGVGNPCGIGDFSRLLLETLQEKEPGVHAGLTIGPGAFPLAQAWRVVGEADAVVANFPVVAWKRALFGPIAAFTVAAARKRRRLAILHEWRGMHWLRRFVLRPVLLLSNRIVFVSPQVREELAADPLVGFLAHRAVLMPLPPNLAMPAATSASALRDRLIAARGQGRLVLGHFGSIYPGKQPGAMLDIAAALKARGARPLLVFMGSFIKGFDGIEDIFHKKVDALGLADDVLVSGYVDSTAELFGLFETVEAFAYVLHEGLTARRASVLACVQAGRPVVVTEPERADEFQHHPRFRALLENGAIVLAPAGAGPEEYADLILAARHRPTAKLNLDREAWFEDAARTLRALMTRRGNRPGQG
jgi:glycosyltransferase involved in cell wall biosynthesis